MYSWFERHPRLVDAGAGVLAFLVFAVADAFRSGPVAVLIDAIFALAISFRRVSPGLALAIAWLGAVIQLLTEPSIIFGNIMIVAVVFSSGQSSNRGVRWAGFWSSIAGGIIAGVKLVLITNVLLPNNQSVSPNPVSHGLYLIAVSGVIAAALALFWVLGVATRVRRAYDDERLERLESEKERLAAELRVAQETERNRITREMHDAIGHSLTVMIAQSDGARYALASDPGAATRALTIINRSARSALDDVNALLTVLSNSDGHRGSPGMDDLDDLLTEMQASGLSIARSESGERQTLSTTRDLAVFRILQESLTNALKHGGAGTRVAITLDWMPDGLDLTTQTTETAAVRQRAVASTRVGHGIAGMAERVRLVGGSLSAAERSDGIAGFRVHAWVPFRSTEVL